MLFPKLGTHTLSSFYPFLFQLIDPFLIETALKLSG